MKQIDLPILRMINKFIGAKMSAVLALIIVIMAQFSEFRSTIDGLPFTPNLIEILTQYLSGAGIAEALPAPMAALLAFYIRRAGNDTIITGRGDAAEVIHTGITVDDVDLAWQKDVYREEGEVMNITDCLHEDCVQYSDSMHCRDCGANWDVNDPHPPTGPHEDASEFIGDSTQKVTMDTLQSIILEKHEDQIARFQMLDRKTEIIEGKADKGMASIKSEVRLIQSRMGAMERNQTELEEELERQHDRIAIHGDNDVSVVIPEKPEPVDIENFWPGDDDESLDAFYGEKGENQARLHLPYPMKLSWDTDATINSFLCHERVKDVFEKLFVGITELYTMDQIEQYGLDQFGGCLNVREMKGSNGQRWSTHSWGIAIDIDPLNNRYKWDSKSAMLASKELKPFRDLVSSLGLKMAGEELDRDWMHIQAAEFVRGKEAFA